MNLTHLHLLLNHFPIIGLLLGTLILAVALFRKIDALRTAALVIIIAMAAIALPVYFTGEPAEESVENLQGVSDANIESHEDAAMYSLILLELTGVGALLSLYLSKKMHPRHTIVTFAVFALATLGSVAMIRTGYLGGQIRHTELQNSSVSSASENKEEDDEKSTMPPSSGTQSSINNATDSTSSGKEALKVQKKSTDDD